MRVFHGTNRQFNDFSVGRYGVCYFSSRRDVAKTYGDIVVECFLEVQFPMRWDAGGSEYSETYGMVDSLSIALAEANRTGVDQVVKRPWGEWVVPSNADCVIITNIVDTLEEGVGTDNDEAYLDWLDNWSGTIYIVADTSKIKCMAQPN